MVQNESLLRENEELLYTISTKSTADLLKILSDVVDDTQPVNVLPTVIITYATGGNVFSGKVLKYDMDTGAVIFLNSSTQSISSVSYLQSGLISSVTFDDMFPIIHLFGNSPVPLNYVKIGGLEFKKILKSKGDELSSMFNIELEFMADVDSALEDKVCNYTLYEGIVTVEKAMKKICQSEMGQEAIREQLSIVRIVNGEASELNYSNKELTVSIQFSGGKEGLIAVPHLINQIEGII